MYYFISNGDNDNGGGGDKWKTKLTEKWKYIFNMRRTVTFGSVS